MISANLKTWTMNELQNAFDAIGRMWDLVEDQPLGQPVIVVPRRVVEQINNTTFNLRAEATRQLMIEDAPEFEETINNFFDKVYK